MKQLQSFLSQGSMLAFWDNITRTSSRRRQRQSALHSESQCCESRILLASAAANSPPVLANAANINYIKNDPATVINTQITVTDPNNTTLATATIKMTNFVTGQDVLSFTPVAATMGNIKLTTNTSGTMTLTSTGRTATLAQWQTALRAVKYNNTSDTPTTTDRSVTFVTNDGTVNSNTLTNTIFIKLVNPPVLANPSDINYIENGVPLVINPGITVTDPNSTTLASGTIKIINFVAGQDVLTFTPVAATMGNIVSLTNVSGTLKLTSAGRSATLAQWQAAFRSVKYHNTSDALSTTPRAVTFVANDGTADSTPLTSTITITAVSDAPLLANASNITYTKDDPLTAINPLVTVTHPDNIPLANITIQVTNFVAGQDVLSFTAVPSTMGNIALTSNTNGVMTLASAGRSATLAQWQVALRAIKYGNTSATPITTPRKVTFVANDGTSNSNKLTNIINVKLVNPPVLANPSSLPYNKNDPATVVNSLVTVTDPNSATLSSATIRLTNFVVGEDVLSFTPVVSTMGNIALTSNANGVMTLTSAGLTATPTQWQAALRSVKYSNTSSTPTTTSRIVTFVVNDGTADSNTLSNTINIKLVNSPAILTNSSNINFVANRGAVDINTVVAVADSNNTTLATGVIRIANYVSGEDVLSFAPVAATMGNIAVTSNANGALTLSSAGRTATLAQWEAALRSVRYNNTSSTPTTTARTVSYVVNDGTINSNALTSVINIKLTAFAPVVANAGSSGTTGSPLITFSPDLNTLFRLIDVD